MIKNLPMVAFAMALSAPAMAQNADEQVSSNDSAAHRDTVTVGIGAAVIPRYDGSRFYYVAPVAGARGNISGISFSIVAVNASVDVIPKKAQTGGKFVFGPVAHLTLNRSSLRQSRIALLGDISPALEAGIHVGYQQTGVITSKYDVLTLDVAVSHDVSDIHNSSIITPSITYATPLSKRMLIGLNAAASYVGAKYGQTYFGVTPAQSAISGFPAFSVGEGFNTVSAGFLAGYSLSGDLRHGFTVFAAGNYSHFVGETARSPLVHDDKQLIGALGIAYTF
ncbi:MAG: MipA/OmpV family protein [Sphingomonadales bacterium]